MADKHRIPRTISKFNDYIHIVNANLIKTESGIPNWQRLGLSSTVKDKVQDFLDQWSTGNPANPGIFERHKNPAIKNKLTRQNVVKLMKDFVAFFSPVLLRISASANITEGDYLTYRIAPPVRTRRKREKAISDGVFLGMHALGGGFMQIISRTVHDENRASIAADADSIQVVYKIGDPHPAHPNECTMTFTSTRARFILALGHETGGKRLYVFARWYHTRHPQLAGPWADLKTAIIT